MERASELRCKYPGLRSFNQLTASMQVYQAHMLHVWDYLPTFSLQIIQGEMLVNIRYMEHLGRHWKLSSVANTCSPKVSSTKNMLFWGWVFPYIHFI